MKKFLTAISIMVIWLSIPFFSVSAQEYPAVSFDELRSVIDFSASLKSIHENINAGSEIDTSRYFLLSGTVTAVTIYENVPGSLYAEVDFTSAEWQGTGAVQNYPAVLVFADPAFASRFPQRAGTGGPDEIRKNIKGMALCELSEILVLSDGSPLPIFYVYYFSGLE